MLYEKPYRYLKIIIFKLLMHWLELFYLIGEY